MSFNPDRQGEVERREAEQLDRDDRLALESKIIGTPTPEVEGVVNLDDPSQSALQKRIDPLSGKVKR